MTASQPAAGAHMEEMDLLDEFRIDANAQGLTQATIDNYQSYLTNFMGWLDGDVRDVDRTDLRGYLRHLKEECRGRDGTKGLKPSTLNGHFSALNTFFEFLTWEGYVQGNPIPAFRDRYLNNGRIESQAERQLISVEEMAMLAKSILNVRNRAIIVLLAKTGIRRNELVQIDVSDIDWEEQSIRLEPTPKRSSTRVFFDGECGRVLQRWIEARDTEAVGTAALFTNQSGNRLKRNGVYSVVTKHAEAVGLHDPDADDLQKRFTPHCCRHWFTTHLRRSGMKREFIKELRGDSRGDAIDIYDHIDKEELRRAYLANIPSLGL